MKSKKLSVIGLGYIGLPTAVLFANSGFEVVGYDTNPEVVKSINNARSHIIEPGLDELLCKVVSSGNLRATEHLEKSDIYLISVPTPFDKLNKLPDLAHVQAAFSEISKFLKSGDLIILESTCPVGTTERFGEFLLAQFENFQSPDAIEAKRDFYLAYCPERVLPGNALHELVENGRIIGGLSPKASEIAKSFYETVVRGKLSVTNAKTAEMVKLVENSFRDVNIAFANELSILSDYFDVDVWELINLSNQHPRVQILQPGPGVGGHCISVDPWFLVSAAPHLSKLITIAREVNDAKPFWVYQKIISAVNNSIIQYQYNDPSDVTIAIFGITFKPNIDDIRESPSLEIARRLMNNHPGRTLVVDPFVTDLQIRSEFRFVDVQEALLSADVLVLLVDHEKFRDVELNANQIVIDTRGVWR